MTLIKDYKNKELVYIAISNVLIWAYFNLNKIQNLEILAIAKIFEVTVMFGAIQMIVFILDAMYSDKVKRMLIWGGQPLPGEVVFSNTLLKHEDIRISKEDVKRKYTEIYENMPVANKKRKRYENVEWYKIYSRNEQNLKISFSQREWILCRDICVEYFSSLLCYVVLIAATNNHYMSIKYVGYLVFMFIVSNIATRMKANRFTINVIAVDIAEYK